MRSVSGMADPDPQIVKTLYLWMARRKRVCAKQKPLVRELWARLACIPVIDCVDESSRLPTTFDDHEGLPSHAAYHLRFEKDGSVMVADYSSCYRISANTWEYLQTLDPVTVCALEVYRKRVLPNVKMPSLGDYVRLCKKYPKFVSR